MTFREWLTFALHAARFNPDAADPANARMLELVLKQYDALSTRPAPASPPGLVEIAASAVHAHLSRRNVMQYLDNPEDCEGIAQAVIAALSTDARVLPTEGEAPGLVELAEAANTNCRRALDFLEKAGRPELAAIERQYCDNIDKELAALSTPATDEWQQAIEAAAKVVPALKLLPVECHNTPDYAEATGPQFQAMTMMPDAFLALNHLPELLAALKVPLQGEGE